MNHKSSIYANPLIPTNLYFVKLLDVFLDASDKPYLWASVLTGPAYQECSGVPLASIIYRTERSEQLIGKFRLTFRIEDQSMESYLAAVGRWGCVSVFGKEYQGQQFSCISYVHQNPVMQKTSRLLEKREQIIGGIEWPDHVDPKAAIPNWDLPRAPECLTDASSVWDCP